MAALPVEAAGLPYRGAFGGRRPASLGILPLPPGAMPPRHGLRPLKAWRYVGAFGRGGVALAYGRARMANRDASIDLALDEVAGIETVCRSGQGYAWTRKQGGIRAAGEVEIAGRRIALEARAVIDDTAAYYERH